MGIQALADKFEGARGALFAAPLVAALSLGGLAVTANNAYAQDATVKAASIEQINVPLNDGRNIGIDGVQAAAASISHNAQTIVIYGPTKETFNETLEAARKVLYDKSTALNGVIVASSTGNGYGTEIATYVDGQLSGTILHSELGDPSTLSDDIQKNLLRDYNQILKPRLEASLKVSNNNLNEPPQPISN